MVNVMVQGLGLGLPGMLFWVKLFSPYSVLVICGIHR